MHTVAKSTLAIVVITLILGIIAQASGSLIEYPTDYRNWTHIKSMIIQEGHPLHASFGGIHHIYANNKALQGYQSGKFPDGSTIIFDLLESVESDNSITESKRKVLGVMQKNAQKFTNTAGWGFEGFGAGDPESRVVGADYEAACFSCHISQKENDYVFSKWRE
ncbi:MAG: cytochrome P460 family protein [Gammaproteobacteria bacterium]